MGSGWTGIGDLRTVEDWRRHVDAFGARLANPVKVTRLRNGAPLSAVR